MRSTLLTVVLAACIGSAAAQSPAPTSTLHREPVNSMKPQPVRDTVKVNAVYTGTAQPRELTPPPAITRSQQSSDESSWRSYGTLFATLMLMVVIAVRRGARR